MDYRKKFEVGDFPRKTDQANGDRFQYGSIIFGEGAMAFGFGSITCGKCKAEISKDSKFCSNCGESLDPKCPKCNVSVRHGNKFCQACGTSIGVAPAVAHDFGWKLDPGDFARQIDLAKDDRLQYGSITVSPGTTAIVIEDGRVAGQVTEGKYTVEANEAVVPRESGGEGVLKKVFDRIFQFRKEKAQNPSISYPDVSVLLIDSGETRRVYSFNAMTSDPLKVSVDLVTRISVNDPLSFLKNVLKANSVYTWDDVDANVKPIIERSAESAIRKNKYNDIAINSASVATSLHGEVNAIIEREGFALVAVPDLRVRQEGIEAANMVRSDTVEKQSIYEAELNQARMQTGVLKQQAEIEDEARSLQIKKEISEKKGGDTLWEDDRNRTGRREQATHEDMLKKAERAQETERQVRTYTRENQRDDMATESEIRGHERGEGLKDVKHEEEIKDKQFDGELSRKSRLAEEELRLKERKRGSQLETLAALTDLKLKKEEVRQKAAGFDHKLEMDKLKTQGELQLEEKKVDKSFEIEGKKIDLEGKRIDATKDVEIARADVEGSRKLAEIQEEFRKESEEKFKEQRDRDERTMDRFAQFGEKTIEALAGGSRRQQEKVEKMAEKHTDQITDVALAKAKALGTATSKEKEGKDNPKNICPHADCGAAIDAGSKFCGTCGKAIQT